MYGVWCVVCEVCGGVWRCVEVRGAESQYIGHCQQY